MYKCIYNCICKQLWIPEVHLSLILYTLWQSIMISKSVSHSVMSDSLWPYGL